MPTPMPIKMAATNSRADVLRRMKPTPIPMSVVPPITHEPLSSFLSFLFILPPIIFLKIVQCYDDVSFITPVRHTRKPRHLFQRIASIKILITRTIDYLRSYEHISQQAFTSFVEKPFRATKRLTRATIPNTRKIYVCVHGLDHLRISIS